jgi:hypothetical protein
MSNQGDRPRKVKKRRATATVGGTTQSGFANRSMSDLMNRGGSEPADEPAQTRRKGSPEKDPED